jgi:hypothetical protein
MVLTGWLDRREREAVAFLIEESGLLQRQFVDRTSTMGSLERLS